LPEPLSPVMITSSVLGTLTVVFIAWLRKPACQLSDESPAHTWCLRQPQSLFATSP
jgi:hypothetical protein